ncbi:MAG: hypothetical protein KAQ66_07315, partial [Rhodospirillaceae bacterium]|nr:hypothetical protein [Rhodospirillaceae bacterium]
ASGKRTLVVRLGHKNTAILYFGLHLLAFLLIGFMVYQQLLPGISLILPLVIMAGAIKNVLIIRAPANSKDITIAIKTTLAIHALGSLWLAVFVII